VQIGSSAIIPYGMLPGTMAPPPRSGDRAAPIAPVTAAARGEQRSNAWIDASWTEAPARPARIDPYGGDSEAAATAFVAQRYAQEEMADAAPLSLHQRGSQAYQAAQNASLQFQRGELGLDLVA
jgi:hypothetical protein